MNLVTPAATVATRIEPAADPGLAATLNAGQGAADGLTLVRGSLVGRYVVLERIGAGAMGVVFAAYDPELDRKVALKFLRADNADPEARTRLLREAQAMARLAHPNVVAVHDVGTYGGEVFVAMEFVQGVTLRHWLAGRPRGWRETVAVFVAAGRGLAAAHEAGLVHRDLKPENIMIGADERVRVMDFGLARASGRDDGEPPPDTPSREQALALELTRTGALVGTPAYMAPEQWERQESDARADQFSFCVALWEALYGGRPFHGETLAALMLAVTEGAISPPRDVKRAPAWLHKTVTRGLARRPEQRWPSMPGLLVELARDRQARLRRWIAAGAGLLLVVAGSLGVQQVLANQALATTERARAEQAEAASAALATQQSEERAQQNRVLRHQAAALMTDKGREELVERGHPLRALAWLNAAYPLQPENIVTQMLLADALRPAEGLLEQHQATNMEIYRLVPNADASRVVILGKSAVTLWREDKALATLPLAGPWHSTAVAFSATELFRLS